MPWLIELSATRAFPAGVLGPDRVRLRIPVIVNTQIAPW
jgi:hypothetical protein